ncbi:imelysin family protein [Roseomonas marmotae]|uniref:Imelysin family protein n=1 Tax=Roseomonas marmotae TaxID=2768161 RepID=A0ABS3KBB0_9PROT|nr:imelysin family protein [Roseomonas marmotae]MBO1074759.1 imelysin family protein [Roseomonas marmotae]QTI80731.1 imelysin family protein [Roseomonas marmotae]
MHRRLLLAASASLLAMPAMAAPDEAGYRALNRAVVEGAVLPGYRAFAAAATAFAATLAALAKAPADPAALQAARQGWMEAMLAWQGVRYLRFGPAELFSRHQRVQVWPDPRDAVGRDLSEAIARRDAALLDVRPESLSNVAVLGLPAAERLLFGDAAAARLAAGDAEAAYRAALLGAIGATQAAIGRDMLEGWTAGPNPYAAVMIEPRPPYNEPKDATMELLRALYGALDAVASRKLTEALTTGQPQRLEAWRSELSGRCLLATLAAARLMFRSGFAATLEKDGQGELAARISEGFDQVIATATALSMPIEQALGEPAGRAGLQSLQRQAVALRDLLAERLPPALGLPSPVTSLEAN